MTRVIMKCHWQSIMHETVIEVMSFVLKIISRSYHCLFLAFRRSNAKVTRVIIKVLSLAMNVTLLGHLRWCHWSSWLVQCRTRKHIKCSCSLRSGSFRCHIYNHGDHVSGAHCQWLSSNSNATGIENSLATKPTKLRNKFDVVEECTYSLRFIKSPVSKLAQGVTSYLRSCQGILEVRDLTTFPRGWKVLSYGRARYSWKEYSGWME